MSKEYAAENILVNTVCIGLIKSAQNERDWRREAGEAAQPTRWRNGALEKVQAYLSDALAKQLRPAT